MYCPWCSHVQTYENMTDCQLVYQVPENMTQMLDQFIFGFTHDAKYLMQVTTVTSFEPFDLWFINPSNFKSPDAALHMLFMPPQYQTIPRSRGFNLSQVTAGL